MIGRETTGMASGNFPLYIERPKRDVTGRPAQMYACISKTSLFISPSGRNEVRVLGPISGPESAHEAKIGQNNRNTLPVHLVKSEQDISRHKISRT